MWSTYLALASGHAAARRYRKSPEGSVPAANFNVVLPSGGQFRRRFGMRAPARQVHHLNAHARRPGQIEHDAGRLAERVRIIGVKGKRPRHGFILRGYWGIHLNVEFKAVGGSVRICRLVRVG